MKFEKNSGAEMSLKFIHNNWKHLPTSPNSNKNQEKHGYYLTSQTSLADKIKNK